MVDLFRLSASSFLASPRKEPKKATPEVTVVALRATTALRCSQPEAPAELALVLRTRAQTVLGDSPEGRCASRRPQRGPKVKNKLGVCARSRAAHPWPLFKGADLNPRQRIQAGDLKQRASNDLPGTRCPKSPGTSLQLVSAPFDKRANTIACTGCAFNLGIPSGKAKV